MIDCYKKILCSLAETNPSDGLLNVILRRIDFEKKRQAKIRLAVHGAMAAVSFVVLIPSFSYMASSFAKSGFGQFASLMFSDGATVVSYWKEFALLLAESLPLFSIIILLAALAAFLASLKSVNQDAKILMAV